MFGDFGLGAQDLGARILGSCPNDRESTGNGNGT